MNKSYVSPRHRAQRTLELLNLGCHDPYPWQTQSSSPSSTTPSPHKTTAPVTITPSISEWNYGAYEGITSHEIRQRRIQSGQPPQWDIWTEGCPDGESPTDICNRLDEFIAQIRRDHHEPVMKKTTKSTETKDENREDNKKGDVLVVAHGHILRAFAMRWVGQPLSATALIMEAGGVGTLSYEHESVDEPAILLGGGFYVGDNNDNDNDDNDDGDDGKDDEKN